MRAWQTDSTDLKEADLKNFHPIGNEAIRAFLRLGIGEGPRVLVAPKGFGKTLLLKNKSKTVRENYTGVSFYPHGEMLIERLSAPLDAKEVNRILRRIPVVSEWMWIWKIVLVATAFRSAELEFRDTRLGKIFPPRASIGQYLENVLRDVDALAHAKNILHPELITPLSTSDRSVVLFLDNADEAFDLSYHVKGAPEAGASVQSGRSDSVGGDTRDLGHEKVDADIDELSGPSYGQLAPVAWTQIQIGLLMGIRELLWQVPRLFIYTSIRAEAYNTPEHRAQRQAEDLCLPLIYSENELREIFCANIALLPRESLQSPDEEDPIARFVGKKIAVHPRVKTPFGNYESEDAFSAILRHTLWCPRDLMDMGRAITQIPCESRTPYAIREAVNTTAANRVFEYWKLNAIPTWDSDYEKDILTVSSNILDEADVSKREADFAGRSPGKVTPYSYLYSQGLIGVAVRRDGKDGFTQEFKRSGDQRLVTSTRNLPYSKHYFLHPCLEEWIKEHAGGQYEPNDGNVVGYDRLFRPDPPILVVRSSTSTGRPEAVYRRTPIASRTGKMTQPLYMLLLLAYAVKRHRRTTISKGEVKQLAKSLLARFEMKETGGAISTVFSHKSGDIVTGLKQLFGSSLHCKFDISVIHVDNSADNPHIVFLLCDPESIVIDESIQLDA